MAGRNKRAAETFLVLIDPARSCDEFMGRWRPITYRLEGKVPVPCSTEEWAALFDAAPRCVAYTEVGDVFVSTVFLGVDHNHLGAGPPVLFETMTFYKLPSPRIVRWQEEGLHKRYATWEQAEDGHARIVAIVERNMEHIHAAADANECEAPALASVARTLY